MQWQRLLVVALVRSIDGCTNMIFQLGLIPQSRSAFGAKLAHRAIMDVGSEDITKIRLVMG